jgi:aryl-alcohol dehydrogenase-like predicted oxidoreductase
MRYRALGRSGLRVSVLSLGTMTFGGSDMKGPVGSIELEEARRIVDQSLDAGVNLVDTADVYKRGASEEMLGEIFQGRRDRVLLATKVRFPVGRGPNDAGLSRYHILRSCEDSLRRLRTDHIDLYQTHEWDGATPLEETLNAFDALVRQGKVRYVGCSNYSGWQVAKAIGISQRFGLERMVSQQIYYSLIGRDAEAELIPAAIDHGMGTLVYSPLAGGLLSGKYQRGNQKPQESRHTSGFAEPPISDWNSVYDVIEAVTSVAAKREATEAEVALAWVLARPGVTSVVIGVRNEAQLARNLAASDFVLDHDEAAELEMVSRPELRYPYWHQATVAGERLSIADRAFIDQYQLPPSPNLEEWMTPRST